jgi:hypothetical protein
MPLAKFARRLMSRPVRTPARAPIVGRAIEQLEDRTTPAITLSFVAGVATFTSDAAGDTLQVQATANPADILYNSGGIGLASLTGVTQLIYNGNAGNDLMILASPPGTHFAPTNGIQFNAGGQDGDELDLIGGAGTWTGTYNPTGPTTGSLSFTNTPGVSVQNIAFTGLPTIRNSLTSASISITTPNVADTINVFAGPNLGDIGAVQQGPVLIDGGDRDDHGFFGGGGPIYSLSTHQHIHNGWNLASNANITNSTTVPHLSISGTGDGTADFYGFEVDTAGAVGTFDIDATTGGLNSFIAIYDHHGTLLAFNDNFSPVDAGSGTTLDSFLTFTFPAADDYIIGVGRSGGTPINGGLPTSMGVLAGTTYALHLSITGQTLSAGADPVAEVENNHFTVTLPPGNQNGWQFMQQALAFVTDNAFNTATAKSVLAIGVTGSTAQTALTSVATALGYTVTIATGTAIDTVNFNNFRSIYVPSSNTNTGGGISQADLNRLNARATASGPGVPSIRDFINAGGGIYAQTEDGLTNPYGWLQIPNPFTITVFGGGGISDPLRKTPAAIAAGLTITDNDLSLGTPYHNVFTGPAGFNNLLPFVLDDGVNNVIDGMPPAGDDRVVTLGLGAIMNPGLGGAGPSSAITFGIHPTTIATQQYPQMFLSATPVVNVNGAGGADTVNIGVGTPVLTAVNVTDSGGNLGDVVHIFGTAASDFFDVNTAAASTVRWGLGGPVLETITYASVEQLTVHGPVAIDPVPTAPTIADANDTFTVTPEVSTAITIRGGRPVQPTAPGDRLNLVAFGMLNPVLTPTPSVPHGQITATNRATVDWTSIETFPVPLGLGGSFDFELDSSGALTQPEWFSVVPSDTVSGGRYSKYNTGWVSRPLAFDRDGTNGYFPPPGPFSLLLRDGAWGFQGPAEARDFRVAVAPNELLQLTAILGDTATINDHVDVLWSDNNGATFNLLNPAPDTFQNSLDKGFNFVSYSGTLTPTSDSLLVRIRDNAGNYHWTIDALDVRPIGLRADLQLARQDLTLPTTKVVADGLTIDYYTGFKAAAGAVLTVEPQYGVAVDASFGLAGIQPDAYPQVAGFQIVADANGEFSFGVRRPTGEGPDTIVVREAFGWARNTITQSYFLPNVRRIDFGPNGTPVAVGEPATQPYIGVGAQKYGGRVSNALGWLAPATVFEVDRGTGSALQRDFVYGTANTPSDFSINMPAGGTYFVTVVLGDPVYARDGLFVSIVNPTSGMVTGTPVSGLDTPAGQSVTRTFTATADANGEIRLRFGDNAGDLFWTLQALEVRPTQGAITISGASPVAADGMATTTYNIAGAVANSLVTVTVEQGTIVSVDASPSHAGFQVLTDSVGAGSFQVKSPQSTSNLTSEVAAADVTGAAVSNPFSITYTGTGGGGGGGGTTAFRFDFNGSAEVLTPGFVNVRGDTLFTTAKGYGWTGTQYEFERTAASVSAKGVPATQVPLYQDGAWGFGTGVFQVAVTKNAPNMAARVYVGDSYTNWPYIVLSAEGGTPLPLNTSATPFGAYTLTGADANGDGKWDISISSGYVWVINGIDVTSAGMGGLPSVPQLAAPGRASLGGEVVSGSQLAPIVSAAIDRLAAAGNLTPAQVAQLQRVRFEVADLPAGNLGAHAGGVIRLDADADGRGWFVDATPNDDAEFTPTSATQGVGGRGVDLLTVVMHELSHELGAIDLDADFAADALMTESLGAGVRRLPNGGSWALSVDVSLWLDEVERGADVAVVADRPAAAVARDEWAWSDVPALDAAGDGWVTADVPALRPDWFGDDLGGVAVG